MKTLSFVIPIFNEAQSLPELIDLLNNTKSILSQYSVSLERIIFVDDGSNDNSFEILHSHSLVNPTPIDIRFRTNQGKSAALNEGFNFVTSDLIATLDGDLKITQLKFLFY